MEITKVKPEDINAVRALLREYEQWLGIDLSFQNFERELRELGTCYKEPEGAFLVAKENGDIVGCIGLRPRRKEEAELKRLYVTPKAQGKGYGRELLKQAMQIAHQAGYKCVVLDTLPMMESAKALYIDYGFIRAEPYYRNPHKNAEYYRYEFI